MKLKAFAPQYMRLADLKPAYRKAKQGIMENSILPRFGEMDMNEISLLDVDVWIADMRERGLSNSTINNHTTVLRNMLKKGIRYGYVNKVPLIERQRVADPDEPFLSPEQLQLVLMKLEADYPRDWYPFFMFAANTGLRVGEQRALRWDDVFDGPNPTITIRNNLVAGHKQLTTPKGHKVRVVPLNAGALKALNIIKDTHGGPKPSLIGRGYVFGGAQPFSYKACYCRAKWLRRQVGLPWIGTHTFRHTFASHLAMSGKVTIIEIKDLLGHVDISVTMRYAKLLPETHRRAVSVLDK